MVPLTRPCWMMFLQFFVQNRRVQFEAIKNIQQCYNHTPLKYTAVLQRLAETNPNSECFGLYTYI